jgi:hypothetical protein
MFSRLEPRRTLTYARASAALTRSGVNGTRRSRTPVASKKAFATAAGMTRMAGSLALVGATKALWRPVASGIQGTVEL